MTPLREALLCPVSRNDTHAAILVIREGRSCRHIVSLSGDVALIATSPPALELLERLTGLPTRVLDPQSSALLGAASLLSKHQGTTYTLGSPFPQPLHGLLL